MSCWLRAGCEFLAEIRTRDRQVEVERRVLRAKVDLLAEQGTLPGAKA